MSQDERCMQQIIFYHRDGSQEAIGPDNNVEGRRVRFELGEGQHLVGAEVLVSAQAAVGLTLLTVNQS